MPYILNRRPKPKPPQNNVMTISKALKAVNDTMDWTVLFIVLLLVMVQQGTACRYPALLAKLFYIPTETKPNTVFFFQLFPLTKEVYILYFVEIS